MVTNDEKYCSPVGLALIYDLRANSQESQMFEMVAVVRVLCSFSGHRIYTRSHKCMIMLFWYGSGAFSESQM